MASMPYWKTAGILRRQENRGGGLKEIKPFGVMPKGFSCSAIDVCSLIRVGTKASQLISVDAPVDRSKKGVVRE